MHELLAPCAFVGEYIVLTKRQDLFTVLRVPGTDPECLDIAVEPHCSAVSMALLRTLGPEYRVYQYILKRDSPELPRQEEQNTIHREPHSGWTSAPESLLDRALSGGAASPVFP